MRYASVMRDWRTLNARTSDRRRRDSRVYNAKLIELIPGAAHAAFWQFIMGLRCKYVNQGSNLPRRPSLPSRVVGHGAATPLPLVAPWAQQSLPVSINTAPPAGSATPNSSWGDPRIDTTLSP